MESLSGSHYDYKISLTGYSEYTSVDISNGCMWINNIFERKLPNEDFMYHMLCLDLDIRLTA